MKATTNLPTGEHNVSVYSMKLQDLEGQPTFSMILANETGEQVTVTTKLDAFGLHQSMQLLNNLIDDFNDLLLDGKGEYNEEPLPIMPFKEFCGFCQMAKHIEVVETMFKEYESVLTIRINDQDKDADVFKEKCNKLFEESIKAVASLKKCYDLEISINREISENIKDQELAKVVNESINGLEKEMEKLIKGHSKNFSSFKEMCDCFYQNIKSVYKQVDYLGMKTISA